jgi:hypothetical protein
MAPGWIQADGRPRRERRQLLEELHRLEEQMRGPVAPRPLQLHAQDNRCVLHRVRPYDYREARVMRHTRVAGDPASELAPTDRDDRAGAFEPSTSNC